MRLTLAVFNVALLAFLFNETRKLRQENQRLAADVHASPQPSKTVERARILQQDNDRLKMELQTIPELTAAAKRLQTELDERKPEQRAAWVAASNRIQSAIEQQKKELADLANWSKDWERMKLRKAAEARLAEKQLESTQPADMQAEEDRLKNILQQLGSSTRRRLDILREWKSSDKSEQSRAVLLAGLAEVQSQRDGAMQQLGKDHVLFEEVPVSPSSPDLSKSPVFRSLVPDLRGRSATVYLDGAVVWATASSAPASP